MSSFLQEVDDRQFYENLTAKQQAVVDAIAADRTADDKDLAAGEDFSRSYVSLCRRKFGHIIEDRERQLNNGHEVPETERGNVSVEGELDISDVQTITERPVKDPRDRPDEAEYRCGCGRTFDSGSAYGGHARVCDATEPTPTDTETESADDGTPTIAGPLAAALPDGIDDVFEVVDPDGFNLEATEDGVTLTLTWGGPDE